MQTIFHHDVVEEKYGDIWSNAVVRISKIEVFESRPTSYTLEVQADDTYKRFDNETNNEVEIPSALLYGAGFWSRLNLKQEGKESRVFSKGGETAFRVDMTDEDIIKQWNDFPGDYEQSILHVVQYHFQNKV